MDQATAANQAFSKLLLTSFRYPFQGDGGYVMFAGGVFFTIADYVSAYASIMGILIQVVVTGYLAAYAKDVVRTSALGEDAPPGWVDLSDWMNDLVVPAWEFLVIVAFSFGPVIYFRFQHPASGMVGIVLWGSAAAWGCLTFPVLFLAMAVMDSLMAVLNPIPMLRAVWLTLPNYLLVCLLCALIVGLGVAASKLEDLARLIPILPHLLGRLASIYLITLLMRSFGLLYRHNHERLQWY
jgi:hypothetical protein